MKVGDILKSEIKDIPGLQSPYKIIINENCKYPYFQKIENEILLENCNTVLNEFSSIKILNRHRSFSQKKGLNKNNNILSMNSFYKKNSDNLGKSSTKYIFKDNLPLLSLTTPKKNIKLKSNNKIISQLLVNDCLLIKNKIKKLKKDKKNFKCLTFYRTKKEKDIIPNIKNVESFLNSNSTKNNINNKSNKTFKIQNIFEYRMNKKIKIMNNIIDKLNTPIFIYNRTETN